MRFFKTGVILFTLLMCGTTSAGTGDIRFLKDIPTGCKKTGQVVGIIDRKIYDDWGVMALQKIEEKPQFMKVMKRQALKGGANRIVLTSFRVDYTEITSMRGVSYDFKTGTYTGMGYNCRR